MPSHGSIAFFPGPQLSLEGEPGEETVLANKRLVVRTSATHRCQCLFGLCRLALPCQWLVGNGRQCPPFAGRREGVGQNILLRASLVLSITFEISCFSTVLLINDGLSGH